MGVKILWTCFYKYGNNIHPLNNYIVCSTLVTPFPQLTNQPKLKCIDQKSFGIHELYMFVAF
jgi:hypothetical protein